MFKIRVSKIGSSAHAEVTASNPQVLIDHLEASTQRNGFKVLEHNGQFGDIERDGQIVAEWEITAA
ncbi:hypothetical protein SEA_AGAPE74_93 [Mycobacterium phage Agape74]|uniref:Gp84-like domain-containing protein n=1 Tax=Mycobacterium Phage Leviathan TaxID=2844395 RepID=A0A8F2IH26_9CAUD|nr:hypothetical protein PBI_VA6_90 [Mycobacterium phage VA6]QJD52739.1 hypothetical protein PBI_AN3_90 [Mycobacterium phage AN3]QWS69821.1 hypothetical protein SEA_LEVIATHAN_92 [Mycobacterium Phage Leviathan]QZD98271.1 hypothetical protein SEA_DIGNITY_93 [Mycobacterium phage Dignity]QZE10992.1 hypothetical protein SEA_AGAPE74_93 [Mycobacterium phage Agape74]